MSKTISIEQKLRNIGFRIAVNDKIEGLTNKQLLSDFDIERTLIEVAYVIKNEADYRLLSILLTWVKVFGEYVIVEKFKKLSKQIVKERGQNSILNGIAVWGFINKQTKWKTLIENSELNSYLVDVALTKSSEKFHGFKKDWLKFGVKVPENMLRERATDVFSLEELAAKNLQFRNRLLFGACWRSDIIMALELGISKPSEIEKILECSHEPAIRISKEYRIAKIGNAA